MPLYFAYGSNMDERQMKERCPHAVFKSVAKQEGYRLCFPRYSKKRCGGVSSIEESREETVWGVVFDIPDKEIPLLDKSEGYQERRATSKNAYQREEMKVQSVDGEQPPCLVYIANREKPYKPSKECYLNYIIRGAEQHKEQGIPEEYIERLRRIEAADD